MNWQLEIGTYPGILIGLRTYQNDDTTEHVVYFPFVELILTIFKEDEHTD